MQLRLQPIPRGALELSGPSEMFWVKARRQVFTCSRLTPSVWMGRPRGAPKGKAMSFTEGHAWQAVGWGARGEGRGGSWGGAAPSCPVNQSLRSEQGSGHRAQTARGVSFLLDAGLGWRLALPRARGRCEHAAPSVGLWGISSSSRPGGPAALRHMGRTFCRSFPQPPGPARCPPRPPGRPIAALGQVPVVCVDSKWPGRTPAQQTWPSVQYLWQLNL